MASISESLETNQWLCSFSLLTTLKGRWLLTLFYRWGNQGLEKWQGFPRVTCMVNKLKFKSGQKKTKKQNPIQILRVIRDKLFFKNLYFWPTCSMLFIRRHKIIIQPIDMLLNIYYMPRTVLANTKQWTKQKSLPSWNVILWERMTSHKINYKHPYRSVGCHVGVWENISERVNSKCMVCAQASTGRLEKSRGHCGWGD